MGTENGPELVFPTDAGSAERVEVCRILIEHGLDAAGPRAERLLEARTQVSLQVRGEAPGVGLTLVLDGASPAVRTGAGGGEAELVVDADQLHALALGRLPLVAALLKGEVGHRGRLRPFLCVTPVLTALLQDAGESDSGLRVAPAEPAAIVARARAGGLQAVGRDELWAIECRGLWKRFGSDEILCGVDLGIPAGAISVVLGPSGTGKSVLLKHLIGLLRPDGGDVSVGGRPLSGMSLEDLLDLRRRCGILFQDGALWASMTVYDNVALPLRQHTDLSEEEIGLVVSEQLASLGIRDAADRMPAELSGGMRKRAGLARALALDPEILLVDEPDSGLDPVRTALLCDLIATSHAERGGTCVVITHDIRTARQIADYVAVLWNGRVQEAGPAAQVFASEDPFVRQFLSGDVAGPLGMA